MNPSSPTPTPSKPKTRRRGRLRLVLWTAGSVAVLALVIFAVSALSSPKRVPELPEVQVAAAQSRKDYSEALSALASGDATAATQLLERAVSEDPNNTAAKKKLEELRSGPLPKGTKQPQTAKPGTTAPAAGGQSGDTTTAAPATAPADDPAWNEPVEDIKELLPSQIPGFQPGQPAAAKTDVELPLDPERSLVSRVAAAQVSVHDRGTAEAARAYVTQHSGTLYGQGAKTVDVNGAQASTGTDGSRIAAVLFSRGRFAFEVVVTSAGSDPSKVLDVALDVARAFPTEP